MGRLGAIKKRLGIWAYLCCSATGGLELFAVSAEELSAAAKSSADPSIFLKNIKPPCLTT